MLVNVCLSERLTFFSKPILTHSCIAGTIVIMWNEAILYSCSKLLIVVHLKNTLAFTDSAYAALWVQTLLTPMSLSAFLHHELASTCLSFSFILEVEI